MSTDVTELELDRGPADPSPNPHRLRRLLGYLTADRTPSFVISLLLRGGGVLALAFVPLLTGRAIDAITAGDQAGLESALLRLAIVLALTLVLNLVAEVLTARLSTRAVRNLQVEAFDNLQDLSLDYFDENPAGQLISRMSNDTEVVANWFSDAVGPIVRAALQIVLFLGLMLAIDWRLTVVALLVVPILLLGGNAIQNAAAPAYARLQDEIGNLASWQEETITGYKAIISNGRGDWASQGNLTQANAVFQVGRKAWFTSLLQVPLTSAMTTLQTTLVLVLGSIWVINGQTTIGTLVTFVGYVGYLAGPLSDVAKLTSSTLNAAASGQRVFDIIDSRPSVVDAPDAVDFVFDGGRVEFDEVDFRYTPDGPLVLNDISFIAAAGTKNGLCGPSGAGKSTIINVLTRYYEIADGKVTIDGQDLSTLTQLSLRRHIGMVPQEAFLFSDTVMANLRYARRDATEEECLKYAREANCHDWIMALPDGYDTLLTERGANLSQGQRQMLTIARAMVAEPSMLILDEATSNVDTRNEKLINEALFRLLEGRTSFVIAHRLATIMDSDQIIVLRKGGFVEETGTHAELMASGGLYHDLFMTQFRGKAPALRPAPSVGEAESDGAVVGVGGDEHRVDPLPDR